LSRTYARKRSRIIEIKAPPLRPEIFGNLGKIGIISTSTFPKLALQRALTKQQTVDEAISDVEDSLEELTQVPFVNLIAFAASIPMSLGKQIAYGTKGLTEKQFKTADLALTRGVEEANLQAPT